MSSLTTLNTMRGTPPTFKKFSSRVLSGRGICRRAAALKSSALLHDFPRILWLVCELLVTILIGGRKHHTIFSNIIAWFSLFFKIHKIWEVVISRVLSLGPAQLLTWKIWMKKPNMTSRLLQQKPFILLATSPGEIYFKRALSDPGHTSHDEVCHHAVAAIRLRDQLVQMIIAIPDIKLRHIFEEHDGFGPFNEAPIIRQLSLLQLLV